MSKRNDLRLVQCLIACLSFSAFGAYPLRDAVEFTARDGLGNFFGKLEQGSDVRIGYLGGSITAQGGWRAGSLQWFAGQYPDAKVSEINAAIGGTGSDLGVYRVENDVLIHKPDLLFVEFAVNDGGADPANIQKAMEGIVRKTYAADEHTDICFVYTFTSGMLKDLQNGKFPRAASAMEVLADHYGIPSIHMGLKAAQMEADGKLIIKGKLPKTEAEKKALGDKIVFSPDNVHPFIETGHKLYTEAIARSMNKIRNNTKPRAHKLIKPLHDDNWQNAAMVPIDPKYLSGGFKKLDPETDSIARRFQNRMPQMYMSNTPGSKLKFRFKGTGVEIYDLLGPNCGQVIVRLDDKPGRIVPRFDAYCTYHRLSKLTIARDLEDKIHTVEIEIHPDQPDKPAILEKRNQTIDNPARYDDTAWYIGSILVLGELL